MRQNRLRMNKNSIIVQMIGFAIPVLFLGFLQQLFNALDVILAGQLGTSGSDAVAAVGSTNALRSLLVNFFMGCSTGSAVTVSHAIGAGNKKAIKETVHTAMLLSVVIGTVLTIIGVVFSGSFLRLMGTPSDILGKATIYLQAYFLTMIPSMIYNFGAAILRVRGETKKPLYFFLITAPVKLLLTFVFVSVLDLDLVGLALSTVLSQILAAVLVVSELVKRNDDIKLCFKALRFYKNPLVKILWLGIPSGIQSATYSLSSVVIQSSVNSLAFIPGFITGNAAAYSLETFAESITTTFYQASMTFVGISVGARDYDRVKKILQKRTASLYLDGSSCFFDCYPAGKTPFASLHTRLGNCRRVGSGQNTFHFHASLYARLYGLHHGNPARSWRFHIKYSNLNRWCLRRQNALVFDRFPNSRVSHTSNALQHLPHNMGSDHSSPTCRIPCRL